VKGLGSGPADAVNCTEFKIRGSSGSSNDSGDHESESTSHIAQGISCASGRNNTLVRLLKQEGGQRVKIQLSEPLQQQQQQHPVNRVFEATDLHAYAADLQILPSAIYPDDDESTLSGRRRDLKAITRRPVNLLMVIVTAC
jgi:hypothetical protein